MVKENNNVADSKNKCSSLEPCYERNKDRILNDTPRGINKTTIYPINHPEESNINNNKDILVDNNDTIRNKLLLNNVDSSIKFVPTSDVTSCGGCKLL